MFQNRFTGLEVGLWRTDGSLQNMKELSVKLYKKKFTDDITARNSDSFRETYKQYARNNNNL